MRPARPFVLVVCDGWGHNADDFGNAITAAHTPEFDRLRATFPSTLLDASGEAVGLPHGQVGNSEVGHLTMGSGRIIFQSLSRINRAIRDESFMHNEVLCTAIDQARERGSAMHCLGLVSPNGVHSSQHHAVALATLAARRGLEHVFFHAFTDGRDMPPTSGAEHMEHFQRDLKRAGAGRVASVSGRYWAMDRDRRWERIERAYGVIAGDGPEIELDPAAYIREQYAIGKTDEFIEPTAIITRGRRERIKDGDCVVFFNFRPDRARQLSHALDDIDFDKFDRGRHPRNLDFVTFTEYQVELPAKVAFPKSNITHTLGDVVSEHGLRQFHVSETEKYAHVTYFINGGRESPFPGEDRLLVPSPHVARYDYTPAMSAFPVTDAVVSRLEKGDDALIVVNFANADMLGHTGVFAATVDAVEVVDTCLGRVAEAALAAGGALLMTADHGNAEQKIDPRDHSPLTAHTTNLVPLLLCGTGVSELRNGGGLSDVAPTVLEAMGLPVPEQMSGRSLAAS
ncbi:MAG: 2,3-bisphosphoglycerate-independent phosphoglycerate mutase [Candidatus Dormibacteria bacterium]